MSELIGEPRALNLSKGNLAIVLASNAGQLDESPSRGIERQRLFDEALKIALENFDAGEKLCLIYSRFEGYRCLADVRFRRGELDEAERLCAATSEFLANTDSRVCQLWLGPLYIEVLLAVAERADRDGKTDEASAKRRLAAQLLDTYQELVTKCQSPRFTREAQRLAALLR